MNTAAPPPDGPNDPADPRIGRVIHDRYRIVDRVAAGAMGEVYRAERVRLGRSVAIKFLAEGAAASKEFVQRFELEAQALGRLSHPNCVSIFDFGVDDAPYLVMDFVHGATLRELLDRGGAMPPHRAINITRQLLAGLAHAHGRGIIHRDVKAGNVMLTEATGTGDHIRILDFGLAKLHSAAMSLSASDGKNIVGTPAYMSPEQARADGDVDPRSDIYGAGILLYEMLIGHKPFDGEMYEVLQMHLHTPPPPPRKQPAGEKLSKELEQVILCALEKEPAQRHQDALAFSAALTAVPEAAARPHQLTQRATAEIKPPPARRRLNSSLVLAMLVVGLLAAGALAWFFLSSAPEAGADDAGLASARVPQASPASKGPPTFDAMVIGLSANKRTAPATARAEDAAPADSGRADASDDTSATDAADDADDADDADGDSTTEVEVAADGGSLGSSPDAGSRHAERAKAAAQRIARLQRLHRKRPRDARVAYALAREYGRRKWWRNALPAYDAALRNNPAYRRHRTLIKHLVEALGSASGGQAERLLGRVGRPALPYVKRAARQGSSKARVRAARLLVRLQSRR